MGLEYKSGMVKMTPGIYDPHGHPRVFDPITDHSLVRGNLYEGKAGLRVYTETALKSGIVVMSAMPNEFFRRYNSEELGLSELIQFPISNLDRANIMEANIATQSRMLMTFHLGIDPKEVIVGKDERLDKAKLRANFALAGVRATGLKIFGDESTGGNNVPIRHIPEIVKTWNELYPQKPSIMHLENGNVRKVLEALWNEDFGRNAPLHIAHVSSKEELEAVIEAKQRGMNVTCEVTLHHLFVTADEGTQVDGYGLMKPTLKSAEDVKFLWDNIRFIDIIASDCAPHRVSDKEAEKPAWGVATHTVMLQLLLGAVEEGKLTLEDMYEKMIINPRKRFNLSMNDNTHTTVDLNKDYLSAQVIEAEIDPGYGQNIFPKLEKLGKSFNLLGQVVSVKSGNSWLSRNHKGKLVGNLGTSLTHFVAPTNSKAA